MELEIVGEVCLKSHNNHIIEYDTYHPIFRWAYKPTNRALEGSKIMGTADNLNLLIETAITWDVPHRPIDVPIMLEPVAAMEEASSERKGRTGLVPQKCCGSSQIIMAFIMLGIL